VVDAAVGCFDGHAKFRRDRASNLGRLHPAGGLSVEVVSMPSVIDRLPSRVAQTLLKVDIEGSEEQLFGEDVSWLSRFDCLMVELHPTRANLNRIVDAFEAAGLRFRPGNGRGRPCACWIRPPARVNAEAEIRSLA
jgi:hypothetical protein